MSILLVNYNGAELLPQCLNSLAAVTYCNKEVVLVDNGSSDNSLQVLGNYRWVKVVHSQKNLGFAGGNNLGLGYCSGDFVLLLNNDTIVEPGFLEPLCDYLKSRPNVGVVQGKMILPRFANRLDVCGSFLTSVGFPYHYGYYKPDGPKYCRSYPVFSAKGACLMFRRDIIREVGGFLFDEAFFCYYEESDFCHRVWLAGHEVHFVTGPPTQHLMGATSERCDGAFALCHYLRNMTFSLLSNLSLSSRLRILPPFFFLFGISMVASAVTLKRAQLAAHWGAIGYCLRNYNRIRERHRLIEGMRRQPDCAIFAKILRTPRPSYFVKTFTGKLRTYEDEDLP